MEQEDIILDKMHLVSEEINALMQKIDDVADDTKQVMGMRMFVAHFICYTITKAFVNPQMKAKFYVDLAGLDADLTKLVGGEE